MPLIYTHASHFGAAKQEHDMYALINTMTAVPGDSIGTVLSTHRTIEAAERADSKLQRLTRKANGSTSYLPTRVVELVRRPQGRYIANDEWRAAE